MVEVEVLAEEIIKGKRNRGSGCLSMTLRKRNTTNFLKASFGMIQRIQYVVASRLIVGQGRRYLSVKDAGSITTNDRSAIKGVTADTTLPGIGLIIERGSLLFSH